jgi:hypothetical protein
MTILLNLSTGMNSMIFWLGRGEMRGALVELGGVRIIYRDLILEVQIMTMMKVAVLSPATALECLVTPGTDRSNLMDWSVFHLEG